MTRSVTPSEPPPARAKDPEKRQGTSLPPSTARVPEGVDYREEMPTYTDPVELEAARVRSTFSSPPPPLEDMTAAYERKFGGFDRVPSVVVSAEDLAALSLDGRAGMLVGLLDGRSTIRDLLEMGIFNAADTLAGLQQLLTRGVIVLK